MPHGLQVLDIPSGSAARDLVEPSNGSWFKTRFGRIAGWIDDFYLNLHGVFAATDPPFALLPSLFHRLSPHLQMHRQFRDD